MSASWLRESRRFGPACRSIQNLLRKVACYVEILYQSPDRGDRNRHFYRHRGRGYCCSAAGCAIPADRAARGSGHGHLRRRRRPDHRAVRGHAHRAADERRRQHELHVFAERDGEWPNEDDRRFRRRHRSEHGSDPRAKPRDAGRIAAPRRGKQLRRHRAEIGDRAVNVGVAVFAEGNARCAVSSPITRTSICTTNFCA